MLLGIISVSVHFDSNQYILFYLFSLFPGFLLDEMDLDNDGHLNHEELIMWLAGADFDSADILKLVSWDPRDFPSSAEIKSISEGGKPPLFDISTFN